MYKYSHNDQNRDNILTIYEGRTFFFALLFLGSSLYLPKKITSKLIIARREKI